MTKVTEPKKIGETNSGAVVTQQEPGDYDEPPNNVIQFPKPKKGKQGKKK